MVTALLLLSGAAGEVAEAKRTERAGLCDFLCPRDGDCTISGLHDLTSSYHPKTNYSCVVQSSGALVVESTGSLTCSAPAYGAGDGTHGALMRGACNITLSFDKGITLAPSAEVRASIVQLSSSSGISILRGAAVTSEGLGACFCADRTADGDDLTGAGHGGHGGTCVAEGSLKQGIAYGDGTDVEGLDSRTKHGGLGRDLGLFGAPSCKVDSEGSQNVCCGGGYVRLDAPQARPASPAALPPCRSAALPPCRSAAPPRRRLRPPRRAAGTPPVLSRPCHVQPPR